jgi:ligand-binding sensor domain-containing protein/signal transduction histidine kinase
MKTLGHHFLVARQQLRLMLPLLLLWRPDVVLQASSNAITSYSVRAWQTDDGLPQNSVYAIAQTPDGYLWVGTREGLARFDGVRFVPLGESAPAELRHGWIMALCVDREGNLWIGCEGYGLARLKDGQFTRFSETDGLISNLIRCLLEDRDGALWIGTEGGLSRYQGGRFKSITEKDGLSVNAIRGVCQDHSGNLRIATLRGLNTLDKEGNIRAVDAPPGKPSVAVKFVCEDRQGRIWTGSIQGLNCLDGKRIISYGLNEGLPDIIQTFALEDRAGQLWVGTYHGVARLVDGKVIPWTKTEGATGDLIYTLFEDREGNLWVGTQDGLYRLRPARFTAYTAEQGLSRNNSMSVLEDHAGTIWIGTWDGGLNHLEDGKFTAYGLASGLDSNRILALHEGRDGGLWVGLDFGAGLNRIKGRPPNLFPKLPGLIPAAIRAVYEDRKGTLWVGTSRGLNVLKGNEFEAYSTANGLAGDTVSAILEDDEGSIWIGTEHGLSRWQAGRFTNFTMREGLSHDAISALYQDRDRTLWIGTRAGGLNRYKGGKFTACMTRDGLFSDEVYEILEDDFGYFWMSCRKGIFRVSKKQLDDFIPGAGKAVYCTAFGRADGLPSVQCNGVAKPAGWKAKDGRLWFATIRGVVVVEPGIKTNERSPPVYVEEVLADGRRLLPDNLAAGESLSLSVPPGRGGLAIHYTALSFQAPEKNRFKYKLEGFDAGWIDAGAGRTASYNQLAPGKYRFRVVASNNDGVWNEAGATLSLVLRAYYWQTWWFKPVIGAGVALLLTLLYRLRVTRLRELERLRIQIAANLHDDVGARLTKVAMVTELVDRGTTDSHPNKPHIQNIFRTVREITQAMDEIVWTINPKNDTLDHLANYIFQYAQEYFQDTGVSCRLDVPAQLPDRPLSTEARHNLFMAVKEALNNALKHSQATEVRIGLGVTDNRMKITIADNGCGFVAGQACGKGNGLDNMKQRLEQIGGRLVLESEPGRGTTIRLEAEGE